MEFLRRRLGLIIRSVISLAAVAWVVHSNNWSLVWDHARSMDFRWLVAGVFCMVPTILIVSWRWRLLLGVHGVHLPFWRVLELTMIGQFFSTVGVGTTGGDVFKIFYVARAVPDRRTAVAFTVIVDRVIGMIALLLFGVLLSCTRLPFLTSTPYPKAFTTIFYLFVAAGVVGSIFATLGPFILNRPFFINIGRKLPLAGKGKKLYMAYDTTARAVGVNLIALVGSVPSHMSITLMAYCVLCAMGLTPDLLSFCAIIAIINLLIAMPVSISGIGVREKLFIFFFALFGYAPEVATTFSLTYFALNVVCNLFGGPFYFLYRHETHTPPPDVDDVGPIFKQ